MRNDGELPDPQAIEPRPEIPVTWDPLVDVFLPTALFVMLASLVWFLIDVQSVVSPGPTNLLRWVFGFFMLAVVGIARINARDGLGSASVYGIGLLCAMLLFGYFYSFGGGALGGGYGGGNPALTLLLNYLIIGFIWWAGNYITSRTAVDPSSIEVQQSGFLSSEEWAQKGDRSSAVRRRPHPGRAVMVLSVCAAVIFGLGHQPVQADAAFRVHAFLCMQVYCVSALLVLAMSALSGLHIYAQMRGTSLPLAVASLWILLAFPLAAGLVAFASVAPRLEPREGSWLPKVPPALERLKTRFDDAPVEGFREAESSSAVHSGSSQQPGSAETGPRTQGEGDQSGGQQAGAESGEGDEQTGPADSGAEGQAGGQSEAQGEGEGQGEGEDQSQPAGEPQGEQQPGNEQAEGGEQSGGQEQTSRDRRPSQDQPPTESPSEGEQQRQSGQQQHAQSASRPPPPAAATGLVAGLLKLIGWLIAALIAALALRALWQLLRGVRLPGLPRFRRSAHAAPVVTRDPFVEPFGPRSPLRGQPPIEIVRHVYRAFQAYCEMIGTPRRPEVTAHEFLLDLPPSTESWRPEIRALTDLYAAAEYTPESVDETALEELRPIWDRLMRAVGEYRSR